MSYLKKLQSSDPGRRDRIKVFVFDWLCKGMLGMISFSFYKLMHVPSDNISGGRVRPILVSTDSEERAEREQVLGFWGNRPCPLQRVFDQIFDTGWVVKSTYFSIPQHRQRACCTVLTARF